MEPTDNDKKEFQIETTKLTQEAFLKYKENERNKLIQIFHVTTAVIVALLALTKESIWSGIFLVMALAFMFVAYGCFYFSDFNFATVNIFSVIQAFSSVYGVDGLSGTGRLELKTRSLKARRFRYGYFIAIGLAFLSILLAIVCEIIKNHNISIICK